MNNKKAEVVFKVNSLWKFIARRLVKVCDNCGKPRLDSVFDSYISSQKPHCFSCATTVRLISPLLKYIFNKANLDESVVRALLDDSFIRKSMFNVVRGISHFGLMTPQPTAVPIVIVWNFTNRCNLNCIHCHQDSGEISIKEMTTQQVYKVIEKLEEAGISILTFSGGEPLLRSDIYEAITRTDDAGILCTIASNGTLMTKGVVDRLKKSGIKRVEIGLDGSRAETHDFLRNTPGSFEATLQGIKNCVEVGFDEICATMTLYNKNVDEIQDTIELAEKIGVNRFYLNRLIPAGRGRDVIDLDVNREQKINALQTIYKKFYNSVIKGEGVQCYSRGMTYYGRLGFELSDGKVFTVGEALSGHSKMWREKFGNGISDIVRSYASGFGGCSAGITYAGLTVDGDLLPCVPASIKLGNLLEEDLENIWVNNRLLNYIRQRNELKGNCGQCNYNLICGGCRYSAFIVNGDWLAQDPSCPFGPG
jgi:radical SAM protein with 4Fe4S-binding SPASM domain